MLRSPILGVETQDDVNKNNNIRSIETKHGLTINWSSVRLKKSFVSKYRFGTPKVLNKSVPRRNKNLFRYKMTRSLSCDIISSRKHDLFKLQNLSSDSSLCADKSPRELSRSAKIMRALSFNHKFFRHDSTKNVKKSLNFDLTPSPKKCNNFYENRSDTSSKISTPSNMLDESLRYDTSSTDSVNSLLIASSKSIDENQNQTPQHNRKLAEISSSTDTTKNVDKLKLSTTSLLRSELKKKIDDIVSNTSSLEARKSLKQDNKRSKIFKNVAIESISRNLSHDFYEDKFLKSEPCTSKNIIRKYNPERTLFNIKRKNHKKEGLSCHGEEPSTKHMHSLITSHKLYPTESLRLDNKANNNGTSINQSQAENKIVRKMLLYDSENELPDIEPVFDCTDKRKVVSMRKTDNLSIQGSEKSENCKIKSINLSDLETFEENMQDSNNSHFMKHKNNKEDDIHENMCCDKEECSSHLQKTNSNNDEIDKNRSSELDQAVTQDFGTVVTPKNRRNMLTESIKKSHKKSKEKDKQMLYGTKIFQHKTKSNDILAQNNQNDDECEDIIKNKAVDTSCTLNPQNSARSSTPENVNSTRLLLSQFSSIKKSHKKDKRSKRSPGSLKHAFTKDINQLENKEYEIDTGETPRKNDTRQLKKSSNISHNKKEGNFMNMFMQRLSSSSESLCMDAEYEPTDNEFKIYTPITRRMSPVASDITSCIYADETLPEKNKQMEINLSRCMTPVSRCLDNEKLKEQEYSHAHLKCMNTKLNNEVYVSKEEAINTTNLINEDGRSTPINISTSELFCNMESIKKSHKKNKHNSKIRKRPILKKKQKSYVEETFNSSIHNGTDKKRYEDIFYDEAQPSTSQGNDGDIESVRDVRTSKHLNTTPPNSSKTINFIKLLNTTSIKTLHKKDRNKNAQEKYILMTKEHELSDDGSIFDEKDRLTSENSDPYQEIDNKKK